MSSSRLKWYFHTPHTNLASTREITTLGGRIKDQKTALSDMHSPILTVAGLPDDFTDDAELPPVPFWDSSGENRYGNLSNMPTGCIYYFGIALGMAIPEIKLFIQTRYYAEDDLALARGLVEWMDAHGRGEYCERYMHIPGRLSMHVGKTGADFSRT